MSVKSGTATDYFDLLTILKDFLVNQGHAWGLTFTGTGNGRLVNAIGKSATVTQTITCTATSSTNFTVVGSVTGAMGSATVGSPFTHAQCDFQINAGGVAFTAGAQFVFNLSPKWTLLRFGGCSDATLRSSNQGSPAVLFDNSNSFPVMSLPGVAYPLTIDVQMQATIEVKAFSVWIGSSTSEAPSSYALQYSDNGTTWTTAQTFGSLTWAAGFERKDHVLSASAGSHKWWRLNVTAGTTNLTLGEVKFYADVNFKWDCSNQFQFGFRGPGVDGVQQIHALGGLDVNAGLGYWNITFRGVRFWSDLELSVPNIPNVSSTHSHLLNTSPITYWIVANGGRFILLTRISGNYEFSYVGFGLPYETPTNHPHPLIVGAPSNATNRLFSDSSDSAYRNPCDPGPLGMEVMIPSGVWREIRNRGSGVNPDGVSGGAAFGKVWPWAHDNIGENEVSLLLREAVDGGVCLMPAIILSQLDTHAWGEFDGVCYASGFANSAESLTRVGAIDYLSFSNVNRSGVNHFAAVALD